MFYNGMKPWREPTYEELERELMQIQARKDDCYERRRALHKQLMAHYDRAHTVKEWIFRSFLLVPASFAVCWWFSLPYYWLFCTIYAVYVLVNTWASDHYSHIEQKIKADQADTERDRDELNMAYTNTRTEMRALRPRG